MFECFHECFGCAAQIAGAAGNVVYYAAKGGWNMPYTVQKHDDSLELAAKFFATPEGFDFFLKECEKLRAHRAEEARQKELANK